MQTRIKKIFHIFLFIILFFSACKQEIKSKIVFNIISPISDWKYLENNQIVLSTNLNSKEVVWNSSIDGFLGKGNCIVCVLSAGSHIISAEYCGLVKKVEIFVEKREDQSEEVIKTRFTYLPQTKKYTKGTVLQYLVSADSTINNFRVINSTVDKKKNRDAFVQKYKINQNKKEKQIEPHIIKDVRITLNKDPSLVKPKIKLLRNLINIENKNTFYVMNTQDQFSSPHQIEASKFYESDKVQILINSSDTISLAENTKESLNKIIVTVENHILPRLTKIWGNWYDVNSDGKITILFSSTINTEGVAIGFFNPNDFFQNKSDKSEDGYNPYSNEQDIIYLALPSDEKSYSENTIIATIAHELTHAINFTNKTYLPYSNNQTYQEEETFLDEGLSHLSENLCGFSISGGNIEEEWFYWSINLLGYKEMHKDEEVLYDGLLTNANVFLLESWVRYLEK